jgi:hypothetical protein
MPFNILQVVLIVGIVVALTSLSFPWAMETVGESMDLTEVNSIKSQFDTCSERILETARTGTTNKCFFNIDRGELTGKTEGLNYKIISSTDICDPHGLTKIDERRYIWQRCDVSGENRIFQMLWMFPKELNVTGTGVQGSKMRGESSLGDVRFDDPVEFKTLSLNVNFQYQPGESGKVIELSRVGITETNVTLKVKFVG